MKINRGALIFIGIIVAVILAVAVFVWFGSLFKPSAPGSPTAVQDFFSSLFPFGNSTRQSPDGTNNGATGGQTGEVGDFRKVSAGPVAGFHFEAGGELVYGERETGHIYKTTVSSASETRLTNTTIPAIDRMVWPADDTVVLEYAGTNDTVRDYIATFSTTTPDQALIGHFLPVTTGVFADTEPGKMIALTKDTNGISVKRASLSGGDSTTLFSSPLKSWSVFPTAAGLYAETAPSSAPGFLYLVSQTGGMTKVLGNISGLMALPDTSGRYIAVSSAGTSAPALSVLDTKTGYAYSAPTATFAEKCAWIPATDPFLFCGIPTAGIGYSIEQWYSGLSAFSDDAWVIDPVSGNATLVKKLAPNANEPIDVYAPQVSPDGSYAAFLNKTDLSLWLLKLK